MKSSIVRRSILLSGLLLGFACPSLTRAQDVSESVFRSGQRSYTSSAEVQVEAKQVIRAKAMARAKERVSRMAALKWYGYNPSRPRTISTPMVGTGLFGKRPLSTPKPVASFYGFR